MLTAKICARGSTKYTYQTTPAPLQLKTELEMGFQIGELTWEI